MELYWHASCTPCDNSCMYTSKKIRLLFEILGDYLLTFLMSFSSSLMIVFSQSEKTFIKEPYICLEQRSCEFVQYKLLIYVCNL